MGTMRIRPRAPRRARRPGSGASRAGQWALLSLVLAFFAIPLLSLALYTVRRPLASNGGWSLRSWRMLFSGVDVAEGGIDLGHLRAGLLASLAASGLTVVLMLAILLPTMVIVKLHSARAGRVVEFISLLPLAIPAIALVVGLGPIYRFLSTTILTTDACWLAFAYVILVMPYAYRALDSGLSRIDVKTLVEAARSLGASWPRTLVLVLVPNLRSAILSACFVSVAVVLGEYTIAALLGRENLQTALFIMNQNDSFIAAAMSLLAMAFAMLLLIGMDLVSARAERSRKADAA